MDNQKDNKARFMAILGLLVGVVGLSLGFAAFSNTLTIKSSAEVTVDDSVFNVDFSTNSSTVDDSDIVPTLSPTGVSGFTATNAQIDNDNGDAVVKNLHATFTAPGQEVTYSFYTKNAGELKAFLKSVTFSNVSGESTTKVCTPKTGTTASLVNSACTGITLTVTVGSEDFTATTLRSAFATATAHDLNKDGSEAVTVRIAYETGSTMTDGGFDVAFGDVTLLYSSAE